MQRGPHSRPLCRSQRHDHPPAPEFPAAVLHHARLDRAAHRAAAGGLRAVCQRGGAGGAHFRIDFGNAGTAPFTLLGVALSIFLGFRNNAAYDRWWEARKLWGQMVFEIRNLTRVTLALVPAESGEARLLLMRALAFCHYLRGQLRQYRCACRSGAVLLGADAGISTAFSNKADAVLRDMGGRIGRLKAAGRIEAMDFRILDERLATLAALQAGCERIANTPLPFAYTLLLHRAAYVFCMLLPFGLAGRSRLDDAGVHRGDRVFLLRSRRPCRRNSKTPSAWR